MADVTHLKDLIPDPNNARRHTPRGVGMIEDALHEVGAARSIVIDENNVVLAGNATIEAAASAGIERVQVVNADGETIIAVRRSGLTDAQKKRLALFDNRTGDLSDFDPDILAQLQAEHTALLDGLFHDNELEALTYAATHDVLEGVVSNTVRNSQWDMINNRKDRREFIYFECGDISVLFPTTLHDQLNEHIDDPKYTSRQEGLIAVIKKGLNQCSE